MDYREKMEKRANHPFNGCGFSSGDGWDDDISRAITLPDKETP